MTKIAPVAWNLDQKSVSGTEAPELAVDVALVTLVEGAEAIVKT